MPNFCFTSLHRASLLDDGRSHPNRRRARCAVSFTSAPSSLLPQCVPARCLCPARKSQPSRRRARRPPPTFCPVVNLCALPSRLCHLPFRISPPPNQETPPPQMNRKTPMTSMPPRAATPSHARAYSVPELVPPRTHASPPNSRNTSSPAGFQPSRAGPCGRV